MTKTVEGLEKTWNNKSEQVVTVRLVDREAKAYVDDNPGISLASARKQGGP